MTATGEPYLRLSEVESLLQDGLRSRRSSCAATLRDELFGKIAQLDDVIAKRATREVDADDIPLVEEIGMGMKRWIQAPAWPASLPDHIKVDDQPGVMRRIHLYRGEGTEVRLHLFEDPGETFIHNHKASFASYCLGGDYIHKVHSVHHDDPTKIHYQFVRKNGVLKPGQECRGLVLPDLAHQHKKGLAYFIHSGTHHTVLPGSSGAVLTLYIKGLDDTSETLVLSNERSPQWVKPNDPEVPLDGEKRFDVLQRIVAEVGATTVAEKKAPLVNMSERQRIEPEEQMARLPLESMDGRASCTHPQTSEVRIPPDDAILRTLQNEARPLTVREVYLLSLDMNPQCDQMGGGIKRDMNQRLHALAKAGKLSSCSGRWSLPSA